MFSLELLTVALVLAVAVYSYFKKKHQYWKNKNVPYIEPTNPITNIHAIITGKTNIVKEVTDIYSKGIANNWKYVGKYDFGSSSLVITDLDLLKNVMTKDFNYFTDRGIYINEKKQPITAHLFTLGGIKWRNLRTKLSPTFTSGKMRYMFQTLVDCGALLENSLDELTQGKGVDIKNMLGCFSTDIIGSCAFGLDCNTIKEPNSPFRVYSKKIFNRTTFQSLKSAISLAAPGLARALGLTNFPEDVERFFNNIVKETVEYREKNNVVRKDFLQLLLDINKNHEVGKEHTGDGTSLTMDEIVAQSFVFFIAGFETSSTTMSFALFELASNPDIQAKVREEIHRVLKKHDDKITYDSMKDMTYLQQVIDETLRMYPAVPFLTRECMADYKVPDSDLVIDKGTRVFIPIKGIHYNENIYPNSKVFDPERFTADAINSRHQYAHIPFGEGPRICIGMRFGLMQTKVGMVSILKNHTVSVNERTKVPLTMKVKAFIPAVEGDIWLNIEKVK